MKEIEYIICPKCGIKVVEGTKKCPKCHSTLGTKKSCPKCAKINDIKAKNCVNCGFNFNKKPRSIKFNLIISIFLVICLFILVGLEYTGVVKKINLIFKIISAIFILFLLYSNINYGYNDIVDYGTKEEVYNEDMNKKLNKMKRLSSILIISAGIIIIICLIIYYLVRR